MNDTTKKPETSAEMLVRVRKMFAQLPPQDRRGVLDAMRERHSNVQVDWLAKEMQQ